MSRLTQTNESHVIHTNEAHSLGPDFMRSLFLTGE